MTVKSGLFAQLVSLAKSDKVITEPEKAFILEMARLLDISKVEFDAALNDEVSVSVPTSEFERILQFYRLFLMARVDKEISDTEIIFLKNAGLKFGLPPEAIDELIYKINISVESTVDEKTLSTIFIKHYN